MIKKTVIQYYALTAMVSLSMGMIAAIYATFLTSFGLNPFQVNMVNFVFFFTLFVCEIPTGAFADIFGRKASFVAGCFLLSAGTFIYSMMSGFWGFALAEIILAIGVTFQSGAFQAWVVDKLRHHGYDGALHKVFSRSQFLAKGANMIAALIGSRIAEFGRSLPWAVMGIILSATGILAWLWLKEEYFIRQKLSFKNGWQSIKNTVSQSIEFGINHKVVRFLLIVGLVQVLAVQAPNMQWQPYFLEFLHEERLLGWVWVGMMSALMVGNLIAGHLLAMIKSEKVAIITCQIMTGLGIALVTVLPFPIGLTLYILHEIPRGMYGPLKDKFLHDNIPSHARATISSFESISPHLGGAIGLLCSGVLANSLGISAAWIASGLFLVAATLFVAKNGHKQK